MRLLPCEAHRRAIAAAEKALQETFTPESCRAAARHAASVRREAEKCTACKLLPERS